MNGGALDALTPPTLDPLAMGLRERDDRGLGAHRAQVHGELRVPGQGRGDVEPTRRLGGAPKLGQHAPTHQSGTRNGAVGIAQPHASKYLTNFEHLEPPVGHRPLPLSECAEEGTGGKRWSETSVQHRRSGSIKANMEWLHIGGHRQAYPAPALRARRRVETPPGVQAQADWASFPGVWVGGMRGDLLAFLLTLSFSRAWALVWNERKHLLAWLSVHNAALERLGGVPATIRADNEKTAVVAGAGAWGTVHPVYERYAQTLRFHVDVSPPRSPEAKGKVQRRTSCSTWVPVIGRILGAHPTGQLMCYFTGQTVASWHYCCPGAAHAAILR